MGKPYKYRDQWPRIAERINACKINDSRRDEFLKLAAWHLKDKETYQEIEAATGVPWPMIAAIHRRESPSWDAYLGNGQKLNMRTTIVPKGRGPFCDSLPAPRSAFVAGAIDALTLQGFTKVVPPWPAEKILYHLEAYNGLGYFNRGLPSPYIWGGTNIQKKGKYVADGKFDPNHYDMQPGCFGILWAIGQKDKSYKYTRETL